MKSDYQNLEKELSVLGKNAHLSLMQKQAIRDKVFKKIGQANLIDSMQTKTESMDLIMPIKKLQDIFRPRKIMLSLPATLGLLATVFVATFTTGAVARTAEPGDALFGVRKALETVQVAFITNPAQKAAVQLSIADERLKGLENITPEKLTAALNESQRAIAMAQTSVKSLETADAASSRDLVSQLQTIINNQKSILTTIVKDNIDNEDIKKSIIAVRDELDDILPPAASVGEKPAIPAVPAVPTNWNGVMGSYTAKPVLLIGETRYFLVGSTVNLIPYMGATNVSVFGRLEGDTIFLSKVLVNGEVVFDINLKNNLVDNTTSSSGREQSN